MNWPMSGVLLPGLRRPQVVAVLRLELGLVVRILEEILAVVEDEEIAVVRESVDLAVDLHLVVAVRGRDVVELRAVVVLVDPGVQLLQRAGLDQVRHPARDDVQRVIGAGAGAVLLEDLGEHLGRRHLDDLDLDTGQLLPLRAGEVEGVEGLKPRLPHDADLRSGVLLGRFHRPLGRGLRRGDAACREADRRGGGRYPCSCFHSVILPWCVCTEVSRPPCAGEARSLRIVAHRFGGIKWSRPAVLSVCPAVWPGPAPPRRDDEHRACTGGDFRLSSP